MNMTTPRAISKPGCPSSGPRSGGTARTVRPRGRRAPSAKRTPPRRRSGPPGSAVPAATRAAAAGTGHARPTGACCCAWNATSDSRWPRSRAALASRGSSRSRRRTLSRHASMWRPRTSTASGWWPPPGARAGSSLEGRCRFSADSSISGYRVRKRSSSAAVGSSSGRPCNPHSSRVRSSLVTASATSGSPCSSRKTVLPSSVRSQVTAQSGGSGRTSSVVTCEG